MTDQKKASGTTAACFTRYSGEIERAYEESGEFRSICADLLACHSALDHWNKADTEVGAARREEYGELLESLKREVLEWLAAHGFLGEDDMSG